MKKFLRSFNGCAAACICTTEPSRPTQLSSDGRHVLGIDSGSWHVVSVQPDGRVTGCARYRAYGKNTQPEHLDAWRSALANDRTWRGTLHMALESEISLARKRKVDYVEVGGWAISEDMRFTLEAMNIALSTYALAQQHWRRYRSDDGNGTQLLVADPAQDWRALAGSSRLPAAVLFRPSVRLRDGAAALRFERAESQIPESHR